MGTRISRDFSFLAAVYFEGNFVMNNYNFTLTLTVETDSINEQNIAMDRIKYFVHNQLENSVFVQDTETRIIEKYKAADLKVCLLPEEPYDQIITLLLLQKINAICEGRLIATNIELVSSLGDDVGFLYELEEFPLPNNLLEGWWTNNLISFSKNTQGKKDKVVKLVKKNDWASLGLDWKDNESCAEIIFTPDTEK